MSRYNFNNIKEAGAEFAKREALSSDGKTMYVSSSKGSDNNDGLSQARPKKTIQACIDEGPTVILGYRRDTYNENLVIPDAVSVQILIPHSTLSGSIQGASWSLTALSMVSSGGAVTHLIRKTGAAQAEINLRSISLAGSGSRPVLAEGGTLIARIGEIVAFTSDNFSAIKVSAGTVIGDIGHIHEQFSSNFVAIEASGTGNFVGRVDSINCTGTNGVAYDTTAAGATIKMFIADLVAGTENPTASGTVSVTKA